MKRTLILAALGAATLVGCLNVRNRRVDDRVELQKFATEISTAKPALDQARLKEFFFDLHWDSFIRDEVITMLSLQGRHLYAYTKSNRLYQIELQSGTVSWLFDVGQPLDFSKSENPICVFNYPAKIKKDLGRYDEVFIVSRDTLIAIDLENGSELWRVALPFTPSSPPSASTTHVYIGSWNDRVYAINKQKHTVDWFYRTNNDVTARPVAQNPLVYVPSNDGGIYSINTVTGESLGPPYRTGRPITSDPLLHKSLLYVGSSDYAFYVLNKDDGRLEWKHETGGPVVRQPVGVGADIYSFSSVQTYSENRIVYTPTVFAYKRKGRDFNTKKTKFEVSWKRSGPTRFLASGANDVYVLERASKDSKKIVKLDKKKGFFRDAFEMAGVDYWTSSHFNTKNRRERDVAGTVYCGYRNGWIYALREAAPQK